MSEYEYSLLTVHCKGKQCSASSHSCLLPLTISVFPFSSAMHAKPWRFADPLQGSDLGYERSLLGSMRTKPKTIAKLLSSPSASSPPVYCSVHLVVFLGSCYGSSYKGFAICVFIWHLPQRCREKEERCGQSFHTFNHVFVHPYFLL